MKVSVAEAKAHLTALIARAEAGEPVTITRRGKVVAQLGPAPKRPPIVFGDLAHLAPFISDDLSLPEDLLDEIEAKYVNWSVD